jgi:hypothetical protein
MTAAVINGSSGADQTAPGRGGTTRFNDAVFFLLPVAAGGGDLVYIPAK